MTLLGRTATWTCVSNLHARRPRRSLRNSPSFTSFEFPAAATWRYLDLFEDVVRSASLCFSRSPSLWS